MPKFSSYNSLGANIQTGEIDDDAVTTAKIADTAVTLAKLNADIEFIPVGAGIESIAYGSATIEHQEFTIGGDITNEVIIFLLQVSNADYNGTTLTIGIYKDDGLVESVSAGTNTTSALTLKKMTISTGDTIQIKSSRAGGNCAGTVRFMLGGIVSPAFIIT